jgi:hypothetical protein
MPANREVSLKVQPHIRKKLIVEALINLVPVTIPPGTPLYVAVSGVAAGDQVMTSEDAITWVLQAAAAAATWKSIAFGNGIFVAVGGSPRSVMTSTDAIEWTLSYTEPGVYGDFFMQVIFDGTQFVWAITPNSFGPPCILATSLDGETWSFGGSGGSAFDLAGIAFGAGVRVVTGRAAAFGINEIVDGSWTDPTPSPHGAPSPVSFPICFGGGLFVAISSVKPWTGASPDFILHSIAITSADGTTWAEHAIPAGEYQSICRGAGLYVAVGNYGAVSTSPDGSTWTARTAANANNWISVTYAAGQYVAVGVDLGHGEVVMTSPDGFTWTERTAEFNQWLGIAYH